MPEEAVQTESAKRFWLASVLILGAAAVLVGVACAVLYFDSGLLERSRSRAPSAQGAGTPSTRQGDAQTGGQTGSVDLQGQPQRSTPGPAGQAASGEAEPARSAPDRVAQLTPASRQPDLGPGDTGQPTSARLDDRWGRRGTAPANAGDQEQPKGADSGSGKRPGDGTAVAPFYDNPIRGVTRSVPSPTAPTSAPVTHPVLPPTNPQNPNPPTDDNPPTNSDPESDRTPPVVTALRFDPPAISDGSSATLFISASDDISGVKSVTVRISSPSGKGSFYITAQPQGDSGVYTAPIAIPANAETGGWYVSDLYLYDRADNSATLVYNPSNGLPGGIIQVSSRQSDTTPPDVRDAWVEKRVVSGGESNLVTLDVVDDISGVARVGGYFWSRSKSARLRFDCNLDPNTNNWSVQLLLPANADCGDWTIQQVDATDKAQNTIHLSSDSQQLQRAAFAVTGSQCDTSPPRLESMTLSPTTVSNATATDVILTAVITDEGSGVKSMYGDAIGPVSTSGTLPRIRFICERNKSDSTGPWTCPIHVPEHAANGVWKIGFAQVMDNAANTKDYGPNDPVLQQASFEVQ